MRSRKLTNVALESGPRYKNENEAVGGIPLVLLDEASRSPYNAGRKSDGPIEQINVRTEGGSLIDLKQRSDVVAGLHEFKLMRAYFDREKT